MHLPCSSAATLRNIRKLCTGGKTSQQINTEFLKQAGSEMASLAAQCAHWQMNAHITGDIGGVCKLSYACKLEQIESTLQDCVDVWSWLRQDPATHSAADEFFNKAQAVYPYSQVFNGPKRLPPPEEDLCQRLNAMAVGELTNDV